MKNLYLFFLSLPIFLFSEVYYKFEQSKPLIYSFQIKGNISFGYPQSQEEKFNVFTKGNLKIECNGKEDDLYILKIIPSKTIVKVGEITLEDITYSETMISSIISTSYVKMKKNGEIIEIKDINEGILTLSQILNLIPAFPKDIISGKKWKQKIPAFNLPGIPMCDLEFNYLYEKKDKNSNIQLIASQIIKETKKDKDTKVVFTGRNLSKGIFIFNEEEGEINNFDSDISLDLNIKFEIPGSPEEKSKKIETISMKLSLNLKILLSKLSSNI